MTPHEPERLDRIFAALAHPVRRSILERCSDAPMSVAELANPHSISLNAVSKHIKTLESAQLVSREQDGNYHRIRTQIDTLKPALDWLQHHVQLWDSSLRALKTGLEKSR